MTTREWWDKIGGFDTRLEPAVYEDVLYCLSVSKAGGSILYEPSAMFYHWQHGSQTEATGWFTRENLDRNLMYIFQKIGQPVESDAIFYNMMGK
jgi:GT2 family glycosyltransferase